MKKALLLYSSIDGQAFAIISRIALYIAERAEGIQYEIYDIQKMPAIKLADYSAVLIGAVSRHGFLNRSFLNYINIHYSEINTMKSALFIVDLAARRVGNDTPETNSRTRQFLSKTHWKPSIVGVFAGSIRYLDYCIINKVCTKLIMRLKGEKHDLTKEYDYTDWDKVNNFSQSFINLIN